MAAEIQSTSEGIDVINVVSSNSIIREAVRNDVDVVNFILQKNVKNINFDEKVFILKLIPRPSMQNLIMKNTSNVLVEATLKIGTKSMCGLNK